MEDADESINADLSNEVEQPNKDADDDNATDNDSGVLQNLLGGRPNDLLQFAAQLTEVLTGLAPGSLLMLCFAAFIVLYMQEQRKHRPKDE